ncbi:MAG: transketolase, partial [Clostridia bacterium]|nr:transketolase [Clostridia bacterium]
GLQIDGNITDVMSPLPVDEKFKAFQWHVITVDGHDIPALYDAICEAKSVKGKPTVIIMNTIKGKGVSYMENQAGWHGVAPKEEDYQKGLAEIEARIKELEAAL